MVTSPYFNNYTNFGEQNLLEDLIIESIKQIGENMFFIPRVIGNFDNLMTEDDQSLYNQTYLVEMYIKSVDGFTGDGNFMSKFGIEIRDQVTFSISQRVFNQEIGIYTNQSRPNEGDLIYFPLNKKCFQIKSVNKFEMFYQLGGLQTWEMTCELFEYSNEVINTGIPEIDTVEKNFSTNILDYAILSETGTTLVDEDGDILVSELYNIQNIDKSEENDTIMFGSSANNTTSSGANKLIPFDPNNPFTDEIL